jgi:hypothetical protein
MILFMYGTSFVILCADGMYNLHMHAATATRMRIFKDNLSNPCISLGLTAATIINKNKFAIGNDFANEKA